MLVQGTGPRECMLRIQVCSVKPSAHQRAPQVKRNGLALPAIQLHANGECLL